MNLSDEAVQLAAEGFYMSGAGGTEKHWDDLPNAQKTHFRRRARIALSAALPVLLAAAWEDGANAADGKWIILQHNPYKTT